MNEGWMIGSRWLDGRWLDGSLNAINGLDTFKPSKCVDYKC